MPDAKKKLTKAQDDQEMIDANCIFDEGDDSLAEAACGLDGDDNCANVGIEWCDWQCPFSAEAKHNRIRKRKLTETPLLNEAGRAAINGGAK